MILTEKQQKHQYHHQEKLINIEYLTVEKILPSDQSGIIEHAKFTFPPLSKAFEKQTKTIEEQGKKQVEA